MAIGPGKYDDLTTYVREQSNADTAIVIVMDGNKGSGFSVQTRNLKLLARLPDLLRQMADDIEQDFKA